MSVMIALTPPLDSPHEAIKNEIDEIISTQIAIFRQPGPLSSSTLDEFHDRTEKLKTLCQEMDRLRVLELKKRLDKVA